MRQDRGPCLARDLATPVTRPHPNGEQVASLRLLAVLLLLCAVRLCLVLRADPHLRSAFYLCSRSRARTHHAPYFPVGSAVLKASSSPSPWQLQRAGLRGPRRGALCSLVVHGVHRCTRRQGAGARVALQGRLKSGLNSPSTRSNGPIERELQGDSEAPQPQAPEATALRAVRSLQHVLGIIRRGSKVPFGRSRAMHGVPRISNPSNSRTRQPG